MLLNYLKKGVLVYGIDLDPIHSSISEIQIHIEERSWGVIVFEQKTFLKLIKIGRKVIGVLPAGLLFINQNGKYYKIQLGEIQSSCAKRVEERNVARGSDQGMAEAFGAKVLETVVSRLADEVVDSIWRQIGYVWNYKSNIEDLNKQLNKLKAERLSLQHSVDEFTRNGGLPEDVVVEN
ncbi:hypothetical protein M5689_023416 [Euphorbia peplus]|nr:hypothetical protein M5689_023416 [Euphorbia peplus]